MVAKSKLSENSNMFTVANDHARPVPVALKNRLLQHLKLIYPKQEVDTLCNQIISVFWPKEGGNAPRSSSRQVTEPMWDEKDTMLITYGNSLQNGTHPPLMLLHDFVDVHLKGKVNGVHVLPFFPWTSDDGFAVSDYNTVDSQLGSWDHLTRLSLDYRLMGDLVLNHISSSHKWFSQFLQDQEPGKDYFHVVDPSLDLSEVVRPRPHPLLRKVETPSGEKHVWCTFSHDQVDVNFENPDLLLEFIKIMRLHLDMGITTIRLDAVAFVWKTLGTNCIHLDETHEIVRLMRTLADFSREDVVLITETNVPNRENLSYFGNRNEAHSVYNFPLPPLTLYALMFGDASVLNEWQVGMPAAPAGCFYFNFTASHDGIGVRPAEGFLDDEQLFAMIDTVENNGGAVSMRSMPDGSKRPYEMNIALYDAMRTTAKGEEDGYQSARFYCSQTMMMALEGIPAFYIHSLLATPNDHERVRRVGYNRAINRHQWDYTELEDLLEDPNSQQSRVLTELLRRIDIRTKQKAFHPNAAQTTLDLGSAFFAVARKSLDREQWVFAIHNVTDQEQSLNMDNLKMLESEDWVDLLSGSVVDDTRAELKLQPYQCVWLSNLLPEEIVY